MKIRIENLTRDFGNFRAVDNISFSFESGDIMGFVGHNGAGKSTTMGIMSTLDIPTSGNVYYDDLSVIEDQEKIHAVIGYVPDDLQIYKNTTIHEYIDFFARAYGLTGDVREEMVENIEKFTGVDKIKDKLLKSLSKGMKQRVCLARALVHNPKVLILDEPAAGLDPRARIELRELLFCLAKQGKAILISSHILTELTEICNKVVIIDHGKIVATGTVDEILQKTTTKRTLKLRVLGDYEKWLAIIHEMPGVNDVSVNNNAIIIDVNGEEQIIVEIIKELVARGVPILECVLMQNNLEDVFMQLTNGEVC